MKKQKFTLAEKTDIVMESIKTSISTAELCRKHNIAPTTFGRWMDRFVEGGKASILGRNDKAVAALQKENQDLKRIIGEYAVACDALKKTMGLSKG